MASSSLHVWAALVAIQIGYGGYGVVVSKFVKNNRVDPLVFSLIRQAGAVPFLFLASASIEKRFQIPTLRELPLFIMLGSIGISLNILLSLLGIYFTNANVAAIFQATTPVWTSLLAILTGIEPIPPLKTLKGWAKILGMVSAIAGAAAIMADKRSHGAKGFSLTQSADEILGCLFHLGNNFCMAIYVLVQKKFIFNKEDSPWKSKPITVTTWSYFFGSLTMALAALYYVNEPEKFTYFPKEEIISVLYAIFVTSFLCDLLITWCNMNISSSVVTATWPLRVLVCVILSYVVLNEVMTTVQYISGILVISGLMGVVWSNCDQENEYMDHELESYGYNKVSKEEIFVSGLSTDQDSRPVN